jgi:hypothetical protein
MHRVLGAVGFVLLLGACEVHVRTDPAGNPPPPPPAPSPQVAANPVTPAPVSPAPPAAQPAHAPPPPAPVPASHVAIRFARIVHPPPAANASTGQLNVQALRVSLHPKQNLKCGPREVPPGSGHWVHLDCNVHAPVKQAKAFSARKINLLLRGGLKVDDPNAIHAVAGAAGALPDAVDHRADGTEGPVKDQGQVGSCTSFSLSSAMDNAIRRQNKNDTTSSLHIWSHYGFPNMGRAGDGNVNKPIATWELWPYDERVACGLETSGEGDCGPYTPSITAGSLTSDPQLQAKIKDSDTKGHWKVTEYDEIQSDPDTLAALLATGADVWFSMNIGTTWFQPHGDAIPDWSQDQIDGGHAVLFSGYRHRNGQREFLVHNSWGKDWGDRGFAYVSESMVRGFIKRAYKVVVADTSQAPPPASDPNALTDDDCGEDQLVDSVTGQCATICPDDSRPAAGKCGSATGATKATAPPKPH